MTIHITAEAFGSTTSVGVEHTGPFGFPADTNAGHVLGSPYGPVRPRLVPRTR